MLTIPRLLKNMAVFLKFLLLMSVFLTLNKISLAKVKKAKVLILGAGAAGIGFANTLFENGMRDFLVLEAQDYIGGRVRDRKFTDVTIQEGANWIHDIGSHNPFYLLKNRFGLRTTADNYTDLVIRDTKGNLVPGALDILQKLRKIITKLETINERMAKNKEHDIPLKTAFQIAGWNPKTPLEKALDFYLNDFENEYPPWVLSARQVGFTGESGDDFVIDQRGYAHILQQLAKNYTNKILLNTTVKAISYNTSKVVVETSNGDKYWADYAYTTFSTGVLASSNVKFTPALPTWKMKAVYMLPMGHYTKIFLKFPSKFWDNNRHILVASEKRGHYVLYQNLDRAGLFPGKKMLVATVTGFESLRVEKLNDSQIKDEVMAVLRQIYPSASTATDIFVSRWSKDATTYGAYCSPVIGVDKYTYLNLKAPVNKTLWFGGEAATDDEDFGYAHGAYRGGRKQAIQLINCMKDKKKCPVYKPRSPPAPSKKPAGKDAKIGLFNALLIMPFISFLFFVIE